MGMPLLPVAVGQRFGWWTVVGLSAVQRNGCQMVWVQCDCGSPRRLVRVSGLYHGHPMSCGCRKTHGQSRTALYLLWKSIKDRCYNPKHVQFKSYGGKGVRLYAAGAALFEVFEQDILHTIGSKPSPQHSIDRWPNPAGNYEPGNWRWATPSEQAANTVIPVQRVQVGARFGLWTVIGEASIAPDRSPCGALPMRLAAPEPERSHSLRAVWDVNELWVSAADVVTAPCGTVVGWPGITGRNGIKWLLLSSNILVCAKRSSPSPRSCSRWPPPGRPRPGGRRRIATSWRAPSSGCPLS